jgi:hypothetical protein
LIIGFSLNCSSLDMPEYLHKYPWQTLFSRRAWPIALPVVNPNDLPAASMLSYVFKTSPVSLCIWSIERFDFLTCGTSGSVFVISFCMYFPSKIFESCSRSLQFCFCST